MPLIKDIGRGIKKVGRGAVDVIKQNPQLATRGLATALTGMAKDPWGRSYGGEYRGFAHEAPEIYAKGEKAGIEEGKRKRFRAFVQLIKPYLAQGRMNELTMEKIQEFATQVGAPLEEVFEWQGTFQKYKEMEREVVKDKLEGARKGVKLDLDIMKETGKGFEVGKERAGLLGWNGSRTITPKVEEEEEKKYTKGKPYINEEGERVVDVFDEQQNFVRQEAVGKAQKEKDIPTTFQKDIKWMAEQTGETVADTIKVVKNLEKTPREDFMAKAYADAKRQGDDDDKAKEMMEEAGRAYDIIYGLSKGEMPEGGLDLGFLKKWFKLLINPLAPLTEKKEESVESFIDKWSKGGSPTQETMPSKLHPSGMSEIRKMGIR